MESIVQMVAQVSPVTLVDFTEMPYSPALLLESRFDASVTDNTEFASACASGFECYFEAMHQLDEEWNETFVEKHYTWGEVMGLVNETVQAANHANPFKACSVAWSAGFGLGWLSAHALVKREDAVAALGLFTRRLERRRKLVI